MTVEGEHVYHVSTLGVLAHNTRCNFVPLEDLEASAARLKASRIGSHSPVPESYMNARHLVDMEPARGLPGATLNASGEIRNADYFWRELLEREPQMFNNSNRYRIEELGLSPRVNDQWIQYNPMHQSFKKDVLHHHHIDHGQIAIPLPKTVHEQWTSRLH